MEALEIKQGIIEHCIQLTKDRLEIIEKDIGSLQKASSEETKSSAGDKYETGRAMMNLEREKLEEQKAHLLNQLKMLHSIDMNKSCQQVESGALVETTNGTYFIAASFGLVKYADRSFFVISALAPIAQAMLDKRAGENFSFQGKKIEINEIN